MGWMLLLRAGFALRPGLALAADPSRPALRLPEKIAGIPIPDSKLAREAADLAYVESPRFLFNHCMRVFAFSSFIASAAKWDWDAEAVFVASALHDIGLLENYHDAKKTFEAAGADFARSFAIERKFPEQRAEIIQRGIARHTTLGTRDDPASIAMIRIGAGLDVFGFDCEKVTPEARAAILHEFPRLAFKQAFSAGLDAYKKRHPGDAGENNWIGQFPAGGVDNRCLDQ